MYYYIADAVVNDKEEPNFIIKNEITLNELNTLNKIFDMCGSYHSITEIKNIVVENGSEFKIWMDSRNLQLQRKDGMSVERLILISNKLILNYASSIKTYIDIETRLLKNKKPQAENHFKEITHAFYDKHIEYRFWVNFRNFVVHCALPYTVYHEAVKENCQIICTKEHLLSFRNWKHSRADIEKMPDCIDLVELLDNMSSLVYALYLDFYYIFAQEIVAAISSYGEFCREYDVKSPVIIKTMVPHDIAKGSIQPLPVEKLKESFQILQHNPKVDISIIR